VKAVYDSILDAVSRNCIVQVSDAGPGNDGRLLVVVLDTRSQRRTQSLIRADGDEGSMAAQIDHMTNTVTR
jgi:hypothetical protein